MKPTTDVRLTPEAKNRILIHLDHARDVARQAMRTIDADNESRWAARILAEGATTERDQNRQGWYVDDGKRRAFLTDEFARRNLIVVRP